MFYLVKAKYLILCLATLTLATTSMAATTEEQRQAEEQARQQAEIQRQADERARQQAEEQARQKAEAERQEAERQRQADEQKRQQAEQMARQEAQQKAEAERQAAEQKRQADEQARQKAEEQARQKAEAERQEAEQQRQADEQKRQQAEQKAQQEAQQQAAAKPADSATAKDSNVQSAARPFDLDIAAPVQIAGSDAASADFQANVLPGMMDIVNKNLSESTSVGNAAAISVDPKNLTLSQDANVRVYFLGEGAGYANTLGFATTGGSPLSEDAKLIFPNASSSGSNVRSSNEPLVAGDFVDLGLFKAGTALDFFLIADGANGGKDFFSTQQSLNKDGLVHAVSIAPDGSAYLIIGFEDLMGGGDKDYNDAVFAVYIGKGNVANLAALGAPEPSLALGAVLSCCGIALVRRRKQA